MSKMLRKNKPVIILIFLCIAVIFAGVKLLLPKIKSYQAKLEQENKQGQVKELSLKLLGDSSGEVKAKEIRKQICSLTARPESEREKAV